VLEDTANQCRFGDSGNDANPSPTPWTLADVDVEDSSKTLHPTHRCAARRGLAIVRALKAVTIASGARSASDDVLAVFGIGGEQAMVAHQMNTRAWHQSSEPSQEVEGFDKIAGSDFEQPQAGPKGVGQDARSNNTWVVPFENGRLSS